MKLNRCGRAAASWAGCSVVMVLAVGCGSGSSLPSQSTDERPMAHEPSLGEKHDPNPFVFTFDSHPYGVSMKEWAFNWMRREHSGPAATTPTIVAEADHDQDQLLFDFLSAGFTELNDNMTVLVVTGEDI